MSSVDDIWAALKKGGLPTASSGARRSSNPLAGLHGIPGITSSVRTYDKSRGPSAAAEQKRPGFIEQLGQGAAGPGGETQAGADQQASLALLQRDINGLSDPDRSVRRRSIEKLHAALLGSPGAAPGALDAALAGPLLVPLVRLLADPAEKCRELGVAFLAAALPRLGPAAAGPLLAALVPAVAERVGAMDPAAAEPSEEMRLALAELAAGPLLAAAPRPLPPQLLPPLCAALCCQLRDAYADIKKAACTAVAGLACAVQPGSLPADLLQPLVAALAENLSHQHSRVRLASLQALHSLATQHGLPLAVMQEAALPAVRPLAHDHAPAVRAALFDCTAQWAGSGLPPAGGGGDDEGRAANQCRALLPLLLPLLLLGLTDEAEAVREGTYAALQAIGTRLASKAAPAEQPRPLAQPLPGYCHPFTAGPPSPAARCLVQAHLQRLLQQALAELREWTATLRASAGRLLRAALIYGEEEVLPLLPTVVHALRTAVADDDAGVATHAVGCAHVLGVTLPPRHWMPLAAELATAEQQSAAQRAAALVLLSALLYAAGRAGREVDTSCLHLAASTLGAQQVTLAAAAPDGGPLRQQLLAACSNLVAWAGPSSALVGEQLFQLLLLLWAVEAASPAGDAAEGTTPAAAARSAAAGPTASAVLEQLASAVGVGGPPADLCGQYGPALLRRCMQGHEGWTHSHPDWRALSALLRLSVGPALLQLWPEALPALQRIAADHERDPRLRLELLQLLAALLADDAKAAVWQAEAVGLPTLRGVLLPALVWRAGRVPAAARFAALTALATALSGQRLPAAQLQQLAAAGGGAAAAAQAEGGGAAGDAGSLLDRVAGCLDDDYEPDTRHLACHTLQLLLSAVGAQLPPPQLAALQPELLRRLDDSSNRVRVAACGALQAWLGGLLAAEAGGGGGGLADGDAASLACSLLLHLDDPDAEVASAVCAVLEQLAAARPGVVRPLAEAAVAQPERRPLLAAVLAACGAGR